MTDTPTQLNSTLDLEQIYRLRAYGAERRCSAGEVLFAPGDDVTELLVVVAGTAHICAGGDSSAVLLTLGPRAFVGDVSLLNGERRYVTARMHTDGALLVVPEPELRRVFATEPDIADLLLRTFIRRREELLALTGPHAVRVIGSHFSPPTLALRAFLMRSAVPFEWTDADQATELMTELGVRHEDCPVVVTPRAVLRQPTPGELAEQLGLSYTPVPNRIFDLVVIGAGPAGLAAAVYGSSEGVDTLIVDASGAGGQAGSSSCIENYLGFPSGVSGLELTKRAVIQAEKFGARVAWPCCVTGIRPMDGWFALELDDGSQIPARALMLATGARYRRPPVADWERFEGAGIYYAATDMEARLCAGQHVIVLGGGNSAGQAALFLRQRGCHVTVVIRATSLDQSMSRYLTDRIVSDPGVHVRANTTIRSVHGDARLSSVGIEDRVAGVVGTIDVVGVFCFIGAEPASSWMAGAVATDADGFVFTDRDVDVAAIRSWRRLGRPPLPYETSQPGVFAVGDVRAGSIKRVAAAVGEGSAAIRSVHQHLAGM
jgi:thioredoxin reductase (NADPH)